MLNSYLLDPNSIAPHGEDPDQEEVEEDDEGVVHVGEGASGEGGKLRKNE